MSNLRKTILGVPVDSCHIPGIVETIEDVSRQSHPKMIFAVNPEKIMLAQKDPQLRMILGEGDYLIPDGIGIILALRVLYGRRAWKFLRITGIDLMQSLLDQALRKGFRIFIFGSTPEVNSRFIKKIRRDYPGLKLVGSEHGYIPENEYAYLLEKINSLNVDILFVGLGSPKQEKWLYLNKKALRVKVCMGVGGSMDVLAGKISRAPTWVRFLGLEWLFRLFREPDRLKRQMALPQFIIKVLAARIDA
jgi:N-acetylglucosaminyldiphosphoundecaprenol N-acetyl-beta-D-mannosaminyltransferase